MKEIDILACVFFLLFIIVSVITFLDLKKGSSNNSVKIKTISFDEAEASEKANCKAKEIIKDKLNILDKESVGAKKKARAFVSLIGISYVLIHKLVNEGNKYDDSVQAKHFSKNLTPKVIRSLFGLEGKYE